MRGGLLIIIVVAIVAFVVDMLTNKCAQNDLEVAVLTFTHHFVYVFALLGWLLDDFAALLVYLALPFISILHWNTQKCVVQDVVDEKCGAEQGFHHLGWLFGWPHKVTMILVGIGWLIAAVKMVRLLRSGPPRPRGMAPPWCFTKECRQKGEQGKPCALNGTCAA